MGTHMNFWQVWLLVCASSLVAVCTASPSPSSRCDSGTFWDVTRQRCVDCRQCLGPGQEVTIRPCDSHGDAVCGSLKDLHIDWSWVENTRKHHEKAVKKHHDHEVQKKKKKTTHRLHPKEDVLDIGDEEVNAVHDTGSHIFHGHHGLPLPAGWQETLAAHRKLSPSTDRDHQLLRDVLIRGLPAVGGKIDFGDDFILPQGGRSRLHHVSDDEESSGDDENDDEDLRKLPPVHKDAVLKTDVHSSPPEEVTKTQNFSTVENIVWDWQVFVMVAAVFACLLFFFVAAAYSCQHIWQFRTIKRHLERDMEELSAKLALMSGLSSDHLQDPSAPPATLLSKKNSESGKRMNEYSLMTTPHRSRV